MIERSERFQTEIRTEVDETYRSFLTIQNSRTTDSGKYQVVVRNAYGEVSSFVQLTVTGKLFGRRMVRIRVCLRVCACVRGISIAGTLQVKDRPTWLSSQSLFVVLLL